MGLRSSVMLIALVTGCAASANYVFHPSPETARADAPGELDGHAAAAYRVPQKSPQGEVKLAPLGVVFLVFPDKTVAQPIRGLHVRMVVRNGDHGPWSVDSSTQTVDFGAAPQSPLLALLDGQATEVAVVMPGETRAIELYYALPGEQVLGPSLSLQWSVGTPEGTLARGSSSFAAQLVPERTPPASERKQMARRLTNEPIDDVRPRSPEAQVAGALPSWRY